MRHAGGRSALVKVVLPPEPLVAFLSVPEVSRRSAGLFGLILTTACKRLNQLSLLKYLELARSHLNVSFPPCVDVDIPRICLIDDFNPVLIEVLKPSHFKFRIGFDLGTVADCSSHNGSRVIRRTFHGRRNKPFLKAIRKGRLELLSDICDTTMGKSKSDSN